MVIRQCSTHIHTFATMSDQSISSNEKFLKQLSIAAFNEMQEDFIDKTYQSDDVMLLAPTGSGKTLAYLIPLVNQLKEGNPNVQALIVVPSRELAIQIEEVFKSLKTNFKVSTFYGGHSMKTEQNRLRDAPAVIIGTPGRLSDHLIRKSFDPKVIQMVVLDEFDKSLQFGFHEQLRVIFENLSGKQKHLLTSATQLDRLPDFLPLKKLVTVNYLKNRKDSKLTLKLLRTSSVEKADRLMRLVAGFEQEACLVFCNHREAVNRISTLLTDNAFEHVVLHGGMEQLDREKNLIKFRSGTHQLMIATDLASRGLDIPEIKHVVHYQLPPKENAFIHRNGRTARMDADGQGYLVLAHDETLPDYLGEDLEEVELPEGFQAPLPSSLVCVYISAGKKDKISKGDVVGLLTKKGGLSSEDIGLITIMDQATYVAVHREKVNKMLEKVDLEKLKKVKVRVALAN
ncbi:MAG: DEAD/DEAH box helicase [Cyclobacteriaceae bacterium]